MCPCQAVRVFLMQCLYLHAQASPGLTGELRFRPSTKTLPSACHISDLEWIKKPAATYRKPHNPWSEPYFKKKHVHVSRTFSSSSETRMYQSMPT